MNDPQPQLEAVLEWAKKKIASGEEPPWAWYQYMKLIESLDAILSSQSCVTTMESSQKSEIRPDTHLRLVGAKCSPDTVQSRHDLSEIPRLPM